jgi:hypothetical protein
MSDPTGISIPETVSAEADGDVTKIAEDMQRTKAVTSLGIPFSLEAVLGEDAPAPPTPVVTEGSEEPVAELATPLSTPGLTPRGWSREVTARHPALLAQAMEDLVSGTATATPGDPIDPSDPLAMDQARREINGIPEALTYLKNQAVALNSARLARAMEGLGQASPILQAARQQAVEDAKARAGGASADTAAPAATPPPPPRTTRATTTTTTTS